MTKGTKKNSNKVVKPAAAARSPSLSPRAVAAIQQLASATNENPNAPGEHQGFNTFPGGNHGVNAFAGANQGMNAFAGANPGMNAFAGDNQGMDAFAGNNQGMVAYHGGNNLFDDPGMNQYVNPALLQHQFAGQYDPLANFQDFHGPAGNQYQAAAAQPEQNALEQNAIDHAALEQNLVEHNASENTALEQNLAEHNASENNATENNASENNASENNASENSASENNASENTSLELSVVASNSSEHNEPDDDDDEDIPLIPRILIGDPVGAAIRAVYEDSKFTRNRRKDFFTDLIVRELIKRDEEHALSMDRPSNGDSAMMQIIGVVAPRPCNHCSENQGPWAQCVVYPGDMAGACANCWWNGSGKRCSFHKNNIGDGTKRWGVLAKNEGKEDEIPDDIAEMDGHNVVLHRLAIIAQRIAGEGNERGVKKVKRDLTQHKDQKKNRLRSARLLARLEAAARELGLMIAEYDTLINDQDDAMDEVEAEAGREIE